MPTNEEECGLRRDNAKLAKALEEAADEIEDLRKSMTTAALAHMWQPIETAPTDGSRVWVWNGENYGIAMWYTTLPEPEFTLDYAEATRLNMARPIPRTPDGKIDWDESRRTHVLPKQIKNPNAGKTSSFWMVDWATNAYADYDGDGADAPTPTHWMPLPNPPSEGE